MSHLKEPETLVKFPGDGRFNLNLIFYIFVIAASLYVLSVGKSLLIPLFLAVFIWYLINVLTEVYEKIPLWRRKRLPHAVAFLSSLLTIAAVLTLVINLVYNNILDVVSMAPTYQRNLEQVIGKIFSFLQLDEPLTVRQLIRDVNFAAMATPMARGVTGFISRGGIVIIYLLFLFLEQRSFTPKFLALIKNPKRQKEVSRLIARIDADIRMYLGIKTLTSLTTSLLSYVIFIIVGLDFASFWAFTIFLLNFIPTIGSIIATIFPSILALLQFEDFRPFLIVIIGVTTIQQLMGSFLEPRFMGDRLNLSPLVILLSLALWGRLWGVSGMLFSVPITSIIMIVLSHFPQSRAVAVALSRNGNIREEDE
ncbi:AI-2E family transporter [Chitinispirillales bacterium ANBcel5]|uniref:AI-2E family transporter n=1 Tax=Cellulosispirillum alkaliphilum TaxID=3039283 RepID=UPI002A569BA6|nr:AI-2E family transporter [Chitinispirillales bacterium ANBcel5]